MNNKEIYIILIILGLLLLIGTPIICLSFDEEIHYEAPCVDGDGDVNLEGIMCDKVDYSIFGLGELETLFVGVVPMVSGLILFIVGCSLVWGES